MLCRILFFPQLIKSKRERSVCSHKNSNSFSSQFVFSIHPLYLSSHFQSSCPSFLSPSLLLSSFLWQRYRCCPSDPAKAKQTAENMPWLLPFPNFSLFSFSSFWPTLLFFSLRLFGLSFSLLLFIAASFYSHFCSSLSVSPSLCCTCCYIHLRAASVLWATSRKQRGKHCSNYTVVFQGGEVSLHVPVYGVGLANIQSTNSKCVLLLKFLRQAYSIIFHLSDTEEERQGLFELSPNITRKNK